MHLPSLHTPFGKEIGKLAQDGKSIGTREEVRTVILGNNSGYSQIISRLSNLGEVSQHLVDHVPTPW
jgi:hypothetical protein